MEQNKLFKSDSKEWNQSEISEKSSDFIVDRDTAITEEQMRNMENRNFKIGKVR